MELIIFVVIIFIMIAHAYLFKFSLLLGFIFLVFIIATIIGLCLIDDEEMSVILIITYCILVGLFYFIISMINYSPNF